MSVALVHDWLVAQRGGEQVLLELARLFPEAPIFTLVHAPGAVHPELERHPIHTSFVQRLPGAPRRFRQYLPFFPAAAGALDLRGFDLVLSTSHCVAKGVRTYRGQTHVSYVHTPMRYVWDQMPHYLASLPLPALTQPPARLGAAALRRWDVATAGRPDVLLANSEFVRSRIRHAWGREAEVVHPPVDVDFFAAASSRSRRGYLVVSALVPYKRVDLAVELARRRGLPLTVIGDGPERERLARRAPRNVELVRGASREELREAYASHEALLFCAEEDFGIVPVEAMAAGCPVVAYGRGGALETVVAGGPHATGTLFPSPDADALAAAVDAFVELRERGGFGREALVARARRFDRSTFVSRVRGLLGGLGFAIAESPPEASAL